MEKDKDCNECGGYHGTRNRGVIIDQLAAAWKANECWFVPMCGQKLIQAAPYLNDVANMLYLDGGAAIGEVMLVGPGAMGNVLPAVAAEYSDEMNSLSGVYTIPVTTSREAMSRAFPGHFDREDSFLPADAKILLVASMDEAFDGGEVEFAPLMLSIVEEAEPLRALEMMNSMRMHKDD